MLEQLQEIFRKVFGNPHLIITPSTSAKDIKLWDSLMHIELIAAVEEAFSINFSFNEVMEFNNVDDLLRVIEKKKKQ